VESECGVGVKRKRRGSVGRGVWGVDPDMVVGIAGSSVTMMVRGAGSGSGGTGERYFFELASAVL
jgi:hypothetical protein